MIKSIDENLYAQYGFVYLSIKNKTDTCISVSEILYDSTFIYPLMSRNERVKDVLFNCIIPNIIKMGENAKDINVKYIGLSASYKCDDFSQRSAFLTEFIENVMVIANVDDIVKVINLDISENQFVKKLDIYVSSGNEKIIKIDLD